MSKQAIKKKFFSVFNYFERRQLLYQRTILTLPLGTHVLHALAMLEIKRHSEKRQTKEIVFLNDVNPLFVLSQRVPALRRGGFVLLKVARLDFFRGLPPKFER